MGHGISLAQSAPFAPGDARRDFSAWLKARQGDRKIPPIIAEVEPGSAAAAQGLKPGDLITKINRVEVHSVEDARYRLLRTWIDYGRTSSGQVMDDPEFRHADLSDAPRLEIEVKGNSQSFTWPLHLTWPWPWLRQPEGEHSCPIHPTQLYSA